jgi:hypothetical protein
VVARAERDDDAVPAVTAFSAIKAVSKKIHSCCDRHIVVAGGAISHELNFFL